MPDTLYIYLRNCRFRAFHGLYPEERQKGNDFVVNLTVSYQPRSGTITAIEDTIDYGALFGLVEQSMAKPVDLLETLVQEMAATIELRFPEVKTIDIEVEKLHPPVDRFSGSAAVRLARQCGA